MNGISYRRGLDGKVVAKWVTGANNHGRRWLSTEEAIEVENIIRIEFSKFVSDLFADRVVVSPILSILNLATLQRISNYTFDKSQSDIEQYHKVYKPVGILPPDQYMAVVLQATEGCSFNTCTFCTFYRDRAFRIKPFSDFEDHILAVKSFLGDGVNLRRTIFLGDANALVIPMSRLIPMVDTILTHFEVERMGGIYAFLDGFSGEKKSVDDYKKIKKPGDEANLYRFGIG